MTLKEMAAEIGCSRATLDRVLNERGMVSEKMREKVLQRVEELGFRVNTTGKALAMQNRLKFGIIISADLTSKFNSVFSRIYEGMEYGVKTLTNTGAKFYFKSLSGIDSDEQADAIRELAEMGVAAIAISVESDRKAVHEAIDEATENGVQFISYFSLTEIGVKWHMFKHFMGVDNAREGAVAAEMMGRLLGGQGKVMLMSGRMKNFVHQERIDAAYHSLKEKYPYINIVDVIRNAHPDDKAASRFEEILETHPDLSGVIASNGGNWIIGDILNKRGLNDLVKVITFDITEKVEEQLKSGIIDVIIGSDLRKLGYNTVLALYDLLMEGAVDDFKVETPLLITLKECYS